MSAKALDWVLFGPNFDEVAIDYNSRRIHELYAAGAGGQKSGGNQGIHYGRCAPSARIGLRRFYRCSHLLDPQRLDASVEDGAETAVTVVDQESGRLS